MNSENQEIHQRGDSDDEIAELRFQALLTKKENEAEVSPAHKPMPVDNSLKQAAINQPLSNFRGQPFNYRGRGSSHYYNKPYLHTFTQQIASKSVNSNNIVVLTSSDPEDLKPSFGSEWSTPERGRGSYVARGGGWPRGRGRGAVHPSSNPSISGIHQAPPLVLPQDKYAPQQQNTQEPEQKHKLSARMRRLQGSDSDSEDSESDSSDDSTSNTSSSDSNSSSSDSSSSDSDSDSDTGQNSPAKKIERGAKKVETTGKHSVQATTEHSGSNSHNHSTSKNLKSPVKSSAKQVQPSESNKPFHSTFGKDGSRSPTGKRPGSPKLSHSLSKSPSYTQKPKSSPPVRLRRSMSTSPQPRRRSRSLLRRSRTPIRRYGSRSPPRYRGSNSPRNPKSPLLTKSPIGRYRSLSRSPFSKRFRSRSPYMVKRALSPHLRRSSRSPLPPRRYSRSPIAGRLRSRSPKRYNSRSPRPVKRYGSLTPPPPGRSYRSKSPYNVRRYGSRSPRPYSKRIPPGSPRRYRSISPRNARSPSFRKDILPKSPRLGRRSSFSPLAKRYGSRSPPNRGKEPLRSNRSPLFHARGRTPVGIVSSPQRIKRIGSLSPKPQMDTPSKLLRDHSPYRNFPRSPLVKRYGTPPPRRLSPDFKVAKHLTDSIDPKDDIGLRNMPFARGISPRRQNYNSRSPSPYCRNRIAPPGIQAGERNFPPGSQSPVFYGGGLHVKMNRNIPYEKEVGPMGKRFPGEHPTLPLWQSHKSEMGPPPKEPLHHYPPKFMDNEFGNRAGYLPQHPPPQIVEKTWPPGPSGRGMGHFGNGRGHPRMERFNDVLPQHIVMERGRGRGGRGMRGQRGGMRGVHARLGRGAWTSQHQAQQLLYDPPPPLPPFDDPYVREKQFRAGMPPPLLETEIAYFERKPIQPFENTKPLPLLLHPHQSISPGRLQRIPRGPKTPPYSPNRDPSPIEWEKTRARSVTKPRASSRSPGPHRYGSDVPKSMPSHFKPHEHTDISDSRSRGENTGSHKPPLYRSRSPYAKDEQTYGGPHSHRMESRKEISMREIDDRKKISLSRSDDHTYKAKDVRRAYSDEDLNLNSNEKLRERDRRIDERHRSPLPPRTKGSESYSTRNKDYEADIKKERDIRGRREVVDQKGRREHDDQRGRRDAEEHARRRDDEPRIKKEIEDERVRRESEDQKGRREIDNIRSRKESGDQRGRKELIEIKNRKESEEHHKTRKTEEERKERREIEDNRGTRANYEPSDKRHLSVENNLKIKVKKEDEKNGKDERKKDNRGEGIKKEKDHLRYDRKDDNKEFDKASNKSYDKHTFLRHRDEKRESKDTQEHAKKKEVKEAKEKVVVNKTPEEKKKKKKKHKDEDRSSNKSSKKKKKEKKKKKDLKKQKKKSKEFDDEEDFTKKKKKSLDHSSSRSLNRSDGDLRLMPEVSEEVGRDKGGGLKRKDPTYDTDDRESRKRRKEAILPSVGKDDWKWRGGGHGSARIVERRKEEREPLPKDRNRIFSSSDKRSSDSNRGGKGFFVTVNSSLDRHVSSTKDIGKKESGSRLPVHMRLGGKSTSEKTPLKALTGGIKGGKKGGQRMGENIGSLGRRKVGGGGGGTGGSQQHSNRRQGMKGGIGAAKRNNR